MARGAAGNQRRRALSDHVICGALELRRAGPERGTRRFQVARAQCPRRSQSHRWPARGDPLGMGLAPSLKGGSRLASSALKRHITSAPFPKFVKRCGTSDTNFGSKGGASNFIFLVPLFDLKFLIRARGDQCRNFKSADYPSRTPFMSKQFLAVI